MHVRAVVLEREEGGVEAGEPVGVRPSPRIVADRRRLVHQLYTTVWKPSTTCIMLRMCDRTCSDPQRPSGSASSTSTTAACTPPRCASSATRRRPRTSCRTCSCASGAARDAFDARRGELGAYLRLMARSRALDLWREGQAAGRASDRLKLVVAERRRRRLEDAPGDARRARRGPRAAVREALRKLPEPPARGARARLLGRPHRRRDRRSARSVPLGTAKSRIRLGLARLRDECGEELGVTATAA